ncbi:MAG: recombinase family protein [Oscillospiraceae bacterium]
MSSRLDKIKGVDKALNNAVIYARYSSDKQTEDSIEAQVRACRDYAAAKRYNIIEVYADEAISGKGSKTAARAKYQKMLRDCKKGTFDTILIHKYDRIARNLGEHVNLNSKLQDMGITLIATAQDFGTSNEAKIMRTLMWSLSEYYIDNLASETRKGLKENALKTLHNGGCAPFGYDVVNKQYVINDLEASYVRRIFNAALNREGFTDIIKELSERGITGKRGKPIKYTQIYEMLHNEKYTGVYVYSTEEERNRADRRTKPNAIRIENALPIIIDKAEFEEVQKIMSERKQTGRKANYLCSGLVYCECGAKMHAMKSKRKGHTYYYYYCSKHCGAPVVHVDKVDEAATNYLKYLLSEENQQIITKALRQYKGAEKERILDFNAILQSRIDDKQKQYDTLMKNLSSGVLPAEVVADIGVQMKTIKQEIEALKATEPPKDYTVDQIRAWLNSLKNSPDETAIHLLIERIDIKNKTEFNIRSTLNTVLGKIGCGGWT